MSGRSTGRGRTLRYTVLSAIVVLAATASLVIATMLGERYAVRVDVTATGEHELSPRSRALAEKLQGEYEVVIAGPLKDRRVVDARVLQRVADVLQQLQRAGEVRPTLIDTGSASGIRGYEELVRRLAARDAERIEGQQRAVQHAAAEAGELANSLEAIGPSLTQIRDAITETDPSATTNRAYFDQRAEEAAASARALRDLAQKASEAAATPGAGQLPIPDTGAAAAMLRGPLGDLENGLFAIATDLVRFGEAGTGQAQQLAKALAPEVGRLRDRAAIARDSLERLEPIDLIRIAKALQGSSAVIVIGPPGVGLTAIDFAELFPPTAAANPAAGADLGRRAEELLTTALAALAQPVKPIVVLVHGQSRGFFDRISYFELLKQRLGLRGVDVVMWEAAEEPERPPLARLDPRGQRPVVYLVFNTASYAGGGAGGSGPERAQKLGAAIDRLVTSGEPVLMSVFPSTMPTYGEPDPTTAWMSAIGLEARSGMPILRERILPEGRRVDAAQNIRAIESSHPISLAVRGLPTKLEWPIALKESGGHSDATITPLFRIEDKQAWGESQWLGYMQVPIAQHGSVPNPPSQDPRDDAEGPWTVAVAAERRIPGADTAQRLVIVGSNTWYSDPVMGEAASVDGRIVPANPGNMELLEASIYWLAGQDDAIAQSATARAVPLIRSMDQGSLTVLRWLAMAGLPALVLGLGLLWRVLRG